MCRTWFNIFIVFDKTCNYFGIFFPDSEKKNIIHSLEGSF